MRTVWVNAGNDPDYEKLKSHGITLVQFDVRDPRLTVPYLDAVKAKGYEIGVYAVWNWDETKNLSGPEFATWTSEQLKRIKPADWASFGNVCLNIERYEPGYVLGALRQWRQHRSKVVTDYTLEGHKGGIFTVAQWLEIGMRVRYVVPQCYNGAMTQVWDSYAMTLDLVSHGLPFSKIRPFYDAARLDHWWDGYAFTQGRLP